MGRVTKIDMINLLDLAPDKTLYMIDLPLWFTLINALV